MHAKERVAAINALIDWLRSQGLDTQDSAGLALDLAALIIVQACNSDLTKLAVAIGEFQKDILETTMALHLKKTGEKK